MPGPENLIIFQKIASKLRLRESARKYLENGVSWAGIDFGAVYNEWAENEYEPLFGGGSLFWRHFPVPGPENLIIFQKIA